jgi:hypothetical protein
MYQSAKTNEDRAEIKQFGLACTVVMKFFKMGNFLPKGYYIFFG